MLISNRRLLHKIHAVLGDVAFNAFLRVAGGENLYIPKEFDPQEPDKKTRNANINRDYYQGMNIEDLIAKYKLSKAAIYKVVERK